MPLVLLAGILSVCPALIFLVPALTLKGGAGVTGVIPYRL
jgi:hypothetical protein